MCQHLEADSIFHRPISKGNDSVGVICMTWSPDAKSIVGGRVIRRRENVLSLEVKVSHPLADCTGFDQQPGVALACTPPLQGLWVKHGH